MIRTCFTFIICIFFYSVHAQVSFLAFAGGQATSARYMVKDQQQPSDFRFGAVAGVGLKVFFENQLFFSPQIYYSQKGYKVDLELPAFPPTQKAINNDLTIHTIEIAPLFQVDLSKTASHLFIRFGPSIDIAISGKEKFDTLDVNGNAGSFERPLTFSYVDYGRFTASANLHLGYQHESGLIINVFYLHGIGSMNNADFGPRILHRAVGLSVGWRFGKMNNE